MRIAVILVALAAQTHAKEAPASAIGDKLYSGESLVDNVVVELFDAVLVSSSLDVDSSLAGTTLAKPCRHAMSRSIGFASDSPTVIFGAVGPFKPRSLISRRFRGIFCTAHQIDSMQPLPAKVQPLGRRRAFYDLAGLAAMVAMPTPSLASEKGFTDGPEGLQYRDVIVGKGAIPFEGDTVTVCDKPGTCPNLKAGDGDLMARDPKSSSTEFANDFTFSLGKDEVIKGWEKALLGAGQMPPMKVGGTRVIIIPSKLAYGAKGVGCKEQDEDGGEDCTIPPYATVEFTIQLMKIERKTPRIVLKRFSDS